MLGRDGREQAVGVARGEIAPDAEIEKVLKALEGEIGEPPTKNGAY